MRMVSFFVSITLSSLSTNVSTSPGERRHSNTDFWTRTPWAQQLSYSPQPLLASGGGRPHVIGDQQMSDSPTHDGARKAVYSGFSPRRYLARSFD